MPTGIAPSDHGRSFMMKKISIFNEAKPRTAKGEVRRREALIMHAMADLNDLGEEEEFKRILAEEYGIKPGHPRYEKAIATWRAAGRD